MINENQARIYSVLRSKGETDTFAKLVASQAYHESGGFTSNLFKKNKNAFGMKVPSKRKSPYIIGAGINAPKSEGATPYAAFASVEDSALDLLHWLNYNKIDTKSITSPEQYAQILKDKGFYGDTLANYTKNLVRYFAKIKDEIISSPFPLLIFAILIIAIYFLTVK